MSKDKNCDTCKYEQENLSDHPCAECRGDIGVYWEPKEPRFQMADDESATDQSTLNANDRQVSGTHYKQMPVEPWEVMESVLTPQEFVGFLKGNIIKYSMRAGRKAGSDDAGKANHYRQKLQEVLNGD